MEMNEMGGACSIYGGRRVLYRVLVGKTSLKNFIFMVPSNVILDGRNPTRCKIMRMFIYC